MNVKENMPGPTYKLVVSMYGREDVSLISTNRIQLVHMFVSELSFRAVEEEADRFVPFTSSSEEISFNDISSYIASWFRRLNLLTSDTNNLSFDQCTIFLDTIIAEIGMVLKTINAGGQSILSGKGIQIRWSEYP